MLVLGQPHDQPVQVVRNADLARQAAVAFHVFSKVQHLGFLLGPRINAGGRVGRADLGALCLSCGDPSEAARLAAELELKRARTATIRSNGERAVKGGAA